MVETTLRTTISGCGDADRMLKTRTSYALMMPAGASLALPTYQLTGSVLVGWNAGNAPSWYWDAKLDPDAFPVNQPINLAMRDNGVPLQELLREEVIPTGAAYLSDDPSVFAGGGVDNTALLQSFWYARIPAIPEPSTLLLLGIGLLGVVASKRFEK